MDFMDTDTADLAAAWWDAFGALLRCISYASYCADEGPAMPRLALLHYASADLAAASGRLSGARGRLAARTRFK